MDSSSQGLHSLPQPFPFAWPSWCVRPYSPKLEKKRLLVLPLNVNDPSPGACTLTANDFAVHSADNQQKCVVLCGTKEEKVLNGGFSASYVHSYPWFLVHPINLSSWKTAVKASPCFPRGWLLRTIWLLPPPLARLSIQSSLKQLYHLSHRLPVLTVPVLFLHLH